MAENQQRACGECRHFDAFEEHRGQCRRYAPRPGFFEAVFPSTVKLADREGLATSVWPEVEDHDYCGEWERER